MQQTIHKQVLTNIILFKKSLPISYYLSKSLPVLYRCCKNTNFILSENIIPTHT